MLRNTDSVTGAASLLVLFSALASSAHAQSNLYTLDGLGNNDRLGAAVASAGDVDADGHPDLIVGAPEDFDVFALQAGYAHVYSGKSGALLLSLAHSGPGTNGEGFGSSVDGLGDLDGDGHSDVIVGIPLEDTNGSRAGEARVFSGLTGLQLFSVKGDATSYSAGKAVCGAGDADGDGTPDFAVGMPGAGIGGANAGLVRVYSGASGVLLFEKVGSQTNGRLGIALDGAGDFDGDGRDDLLVGSHHEGAYLLSGADGTVLRHWTVPETNDFFGASVRSIEDVTGDSIRDVMIGALQPSIFVSSGKGYVKVLNAMSGTELHTFTGVSVNDQFGASIDLAGDYNGDGVMDFLAAADQGSSSQQGYAQVRSGLDGSILASFNSSSTDLLGASVAYLGDIDGDGATEFAIGAPQYSGVHVSGGRVLVESGAAVGCAGVPTNYCSALPNSTGGVANILHLGSNSVAANDLFLVTTGLPLNQTGVFYYGAGQENLPFGNGIRCVSAPTYRLPVTVVGAGGATVWLLDLTNPPSPAGQITSGSTWYFQYWYRDPAAGGAAFNTSNGLAVPFCP